MGEIKNGDFNYTLYRFGIWPHGLVTRACGGSNAYTILIDLSALNNEHTCFSWNLIAVSFSIIGSGLEVYACNWQWIA